MILIFEKANKSEISGEPNVRFGRTLRQEFGRTEQFGSVRQQPCCRTVRFGSVRPIFSDFYLIVRFGLPNSSAKFWPNSSVRFGSAKFEIGKVRFGSVRRKKSEFGSPLIRINLVSRLSCSTLYTIPTHFKTTSQKTTSLKQ